MFGGGLLMGTKEPKFTSVISKFTSMLYLLLCPTHMHMQCVQWLMLIVL